VHVQPDPRTLSHTGASRNCGSTAGPIADGNPRQLTSEAPGHTPYGLGDYIVEAIETELRAERLPADTFARLGPDHVRIAKTASRSTLGYMKEMAFELEWNIANDGGLDRIDIDELNHALRRQLRSHGRDYARPIELVNEHLANQHRPANT
jgi:hypothetical protein